MRPFGYKLAVKHSPQEISNMLANNMTLDDEEAVQEEFKQLQALTASFTVITVTTVSLTHPQALEAGPDQVGRLPDAPNTEPAHVKTPGLSHLLALYRRSAAYLPSKNVQWRNQSGNECPFSHRIPRYLFSPIMYRACT